MHTKRDTIFTLLAALIYLLLCWWIFFKVCPEVKTIPALISDKIKARVHAAHKKHGNYLIEVDGGKWTMITPKGKVAL